MENQINQNPNQEVTATPNILVPQDKNRRFFNKENLIIGVFALIITAVSIYSRHNFYFLSAFSSDNVIFKIFGFGLNLPGLLVTPLFYLVKSGDSAFGLALLFETVYPVVSLLFWVTLFKLIQVGVGKISSNRFLPSIIISVIFLWLVLPVAVLSVPSVKKDLCLSGNFKQTLNYGISDENGYTPGSFTTDASDCFNESVLGGSGLLGEVSETDSTVLINKCLDLSDTDVVASPAVPDFYFPKGATHQEFCIFNLVTHFLAREDRGTGQLTPLTLDFHTKYVKDIPIPTYNPKTFRLNEDYGMLDDAYKAALCRVYGELSQSSEKAERCNAFFYESKKDWAERSVLRESSEPLRIETVLNEKNTNREIVFRQVDIKDELALVTLGKVKRDIAERYKTTEDNFEVIHSEEVYIANNTWGSNLSVLQVGKTFSGSGTLNLNKITGSELVFALEQVNTGSSMLEVKSDGGAREFDIYDKVYRQGGKKTFVVPVSSTASMNFFSYEPNNQAVVKISNIRQGSFDSSGLDFLGYRVTFRNKVTDSRLIMYMTQNSFRADYSKY